MMPFPAVLCNLSPLMACSSLRSTSNTSHCHSNDTWADERVFVQCSASLSSFLNGQASEVYAFWFRRWCFFGQGSRYFSVSLDTILSLDLIFSWEPFSQPSVVCTYCFLSVCGQVWMQSLTLNYQKHALHLHRDWIAIVSLLRSRMCIRIAIDTLLNVAVCNRS